MEMVEMWFKINLQLFGGRGGSSGMGGGGDGEFKLSIGMARHFEKENKRIDAFLKDKNIETITMGNGQILEKYTMKEMKDQIKDTLDNIKYAEDGKTGSFLDEDTNYSVLYKNGDVLTINGGGDIELIHDDGYGGRKYSALRSRDVKLSNIQGIIYEGPSSTGFAGKSVVIENYNEVYSGTEYTIKTRRGKDGTIERYKEYGYGSDKEYDDWRMEFGDKPRRRK